MAAISEILKPQFIWIIIGFLFIISEFIIPGLVIGFFGVGALAVGILCALFELSINVQLLIFLGTSVFLLIFLRRRFKKVFIGKSETTTQGQDSLEDFAGERAVVTQAIKPNAIGKVEFHGTNWEAEADQEIPKGAAVEIISKRNITLIVKPLS